MAGLKVVVLWNAIERDRPYTEGIVDPGVLAVVELDEAKHITALGQAIYDACKPFRCDPLE